MFRKLRILGSALVLIGLSHAAAANQPREQLEELRELMEWQAQGQKDEEKPDVSGDDGEPVRGVGRQRLLRRQGPWFRLNLRGRGNAGYNSNALLQPEDEEDDIINTQSLDLSFQPGGQDVGSTFRPEAFLSYSRTGFGDLDQQDFSTLSGGLRARYVVSRNLPLISHGGIRIRQIVDGNAPDDQTLQRKLLYEAGLYHRNAPTPDQRITLGLRGTVEDSLAIQGNAEPGEFADSAKNVGEIYLNYRYDYSPWINLHSGIRYSYRYYRYEGTPFRFSEDDNRKDHQVSARLGADYRLTQNLWAETWTTWTRNNSNQQNLLGQERDYSQYSVMMGLRYNLDREGF